jgi:hypothetical protein
VQDQAVFHVMFKTMGMLTLCLPSSTSGRGETLSGLGVEGGTLGCFVWKDGIGGGERRESV